MASFKHTQRERLLMLVLSLAVFGALLGGSLSVPLVQGVSSAALMLSLPGLMYLTGRSLRGVSPSEKSHMGAGFLLLFGAQKLLTFYAAFAALTQPEFSLLHADSFSWVFAVLGMTLLFSAWMEQAGRNGKKALILVFFAATAGLYVKYMGSYLALSYLLTFAPMVLLGLWEEENAKRTKWLDSPLMTVAALAVCVGGLGVCLLRPGSFWGIRSLFLGSCGFGKVPSKAVHLLGGGLRLGLDAVGYVVARGLLQLLPEKRISYLSGCGKRWYAAWLWYAPIVTLVQLFLLDKVSLSVAAAVTALAVLLAGSDWARRPVEALLSWYTVLQRPPRRVSANDSFWKRHKSALFYTFSYTCAFFIAAMGAAYSLSAANKSLVWDVDGIQQQYTSLLYFRNYFMDAVALSRETGLLKLPQFTFTGGQGMAVLDVIRKDPFAFFALLSDESHMEAMFAFLVFFRMWVAGLLFSALAFEMERKGTAQRICGALVYVFSGYTICVMVRQTSFLHTCLVNLPLILWGVERALRRDKGGLFLFAIFLGSFNGYYATWMNSLMMAVWIFIRLVDEHGLDIKAIVLKILKLIGLYLWGICLAMVVFLPAVVTLTQSSRGESAGYSGSLFYYNPSYYQDLFTSLSSGYKPVGYWTINGWAAIALLAVVVLFLKKERRFAALKAGVLVCAVGLCVPFFGKVLNGFGYVSNRWCYGVALVLGLVVATVLPHFFTLNAHEKRTLVAVSVLYGGILLLDSGNNDTRRLFGIAATLATLLVIFALETLSWNSRQKQSALALAVCLSLVGNLSFAMLPEFEDYLSLCLDAGTVQDRLESSPAVVADRIEDDSFYRIEQPPIRSNQATAMDYYGTTAYFSIVSAEMSDYYNSFTLSGMVQTYDLHGLDSRAALEALAGVKYYLCAENRTTKVPYGFQKVQEIAHEDKNYAVYLNENYLNGGTAYSSVLRRSDYEALTPQQRQQAILQCAVVADEADVGSLSVGEPRFDISRSEVTVKESNGVSVDFESKTITAAPASSVVLHFKSQPNSEVILSLDGLAYVNEKSPDVVHLRCRSGDASSTTYVHGKQHTYYFEREGVSYQLGYSEKGITKCELFFDAACELKFDDIAVYSLPVSRFEEDIAPLKAHRLENVVQVGDSFSGTIACEEEMVLSTVVPYSKGWTTYVDGEAVPTLCVNLMYCGALLTPGEHTVELRYTTPGIRTGGMVSGVAFGALVVVWGWKWWRKRSFVRKG